MNLKKKLAVFLAILFSLNLFAQSTGRNHNNFFSKHSIIRGYQKNRKCK